MSQSIMTIIISGVVFGLFHSLTASQRCKQWAYHLGLNEPYYRLSYSVLSIFTTMLWISYMHSLPDTPLYTAEGWVWWLLVSIQILGGILAAAAFLPIDGLAFLGLKSSPQQHDPFIVSGVYRYMRHPMYSGAMLVLLFMPEQSINGLSFSFVVCAYFIIGSRFEEQRMLNDHPHYSDYQRHIPAFIPHIHSSKNKEKSS